MTTDTQMCLRWQAEQIMAVPPEARVQVLDRMQQQDRFFDRIKDPLEKLLGHGF